MMSVEAIGLGKSYGATRAVDQLSFTLEPGVVTGFLGPNGAGKSTTMRLMLGLDRGDGATLWDGTPLAAHDHVTRMVGAHLDAKFFHPSRTARNHLRLLATEASVPSSRIDEVIKLVGLDAVARKRPSGFSLGMGQRLGLAGAILAQPRVLLLDEPANGLDPQSIQWLRDFLRHYAAQGNVVFVSSHLLSEMEQMAEHLVVIAAGRMVADESMDAFVARSTRNDVFVRCTDPTALAAALEAEGIASVAEGPDGLAILVADTDRVGDLAFRAGIGIRELTRRTASLEDAFLELTSGEQQFRTGESA
jgi:ABC-2 type transport system ATP-binding protein